MTSSSAVLDTKKAEGSTAVSSGPVPKDAKKDKKTTPKSTKDEKKNEPVAGNDEYSASFQSRAIPDTIDSRLAIQELRGPEGSMSSERKDNQPPEEGPDGPLLLALLMGNNNNNNNAQAQAAPQPDTLDARFAVHEILGSGSSEASHEDGPLIFALMLGNQNNNNAPNPNQPAPDTLDARFAVHEVLGPGGSEASHEDGPLLFALLLNNQNNNNNPAAAANQPAPDTLDARFAVHELLGPVGNAASHEDGPLLFALMLTNQNNNNAAANQPAPDTLDTRFTVHEVVDREDMEAQRAAVASNGSEPLRSSLMLGQNNNSAAAEPLTDTLDSRLAVMEVTGSQHSSTPLVLKMRGAAQPPVLANEQVQFYQDNGYLVVPDALPANIIAELLQCVHESAEAIATGGPGVKKQVFNKWENACVNPNGRVIAALTERAFQPGTTPLQNIQRLGCGVHRVLPPFRRAIMSAPHTDIAASLGYTDPRIVQSLVIVKAAEVGGKVVPHQDGCTSFTDPPSCVTFWYALEDADANNGCLAVAPGSHRVTPITRRCRSDEKGMPEFEALEEPIFADIPGVSADAPVPERDEAGDFVFKKLEVKAGTLILMHGNLMHTSAANRSGKSRVAFNFGVVEGGLGWKDDNYLQPYEGKTEFERLHIS